VIEHEQGKIFPRYKSFIRFDFCRFRYKNVIFGEKFPHNIHITRPFFDFFARTSGTIFANKVIEVSS